MRQQPVKIVHIEQFKIVRRWIEARSSLGSCGHRHRSEGAAEACRERMLKEWKERRYGQKAKARA